MKKLFDNPWVYRVIALIFAILLFIYINQAQLAPTTNQNKEQTTQMATKTQTVNVTLQISADTEKYFVTGYPEKVAVTLEGPAALVASTVNTMNFRAFIDLSKFKTGEHNVPIEISGLNNQITYSVKPKRVTAQIQTKKSKRFPIQVVYSKDGVPEGYEVGVAKADPSVVSVTGPKSEIEQVDHIEAKVTVPKGSTETIDQEVMLVAVDKDGRQLNAVLTPATTHVIVPISLPSKLVKLKLSQKNDESDKVYALTSETSKVRIYGRKSVLDEIDELEVDVDLKNQSVSYEDTIKLEKPDDVVKINPEKIKVKVNIKGNE